MPGGILSFLIFFPIISGIIIGIFSRNKYLNVNVKKTSLLITGIQMILSILVFFSYDKTLGGFQFIDYFDSWIPFEAFTARYIVGIDGLSAPLILLTGLQL